MPETPELLEQLLTAPSPSGYEGPAATVWRDAAGFAELEADRIGSSIARVAGEGDDGRSSRSSATSTRSGSRSPTSTRPASPSSRRSAAGTRRSSSASGSPSSRATARCPGSSGASRCICSKEDQRKKAVEIDGLHIDVGAADRDEALTLFRIGDPVVIDAQPLGLAGDRLVSRSMDNRLGSYVALEVARRCHDRGGHTAAVAGVAAVQEEIGINGARTSAYLLQPEIAVVVDVTHATDAPGVDEKKLGSHPLGSGPVIGRGATLAPKVFELLAATAEREGIDHTIETSGRWSATDADAYQVSRAGMPTGLVSIPLRYMHSPVELVDLGDVEATVELLVAFASSITGEEDLSR